MDSRERIRVLNDKLRKTGQGGIINVTPAFQALAQDQQIKLLFLVRTFNNFSADNDPHQEHDFGVVKLDDDSWYWKIDYYDPQLTYGSENPADPASTARVMTIMHSREY